MSNLGEMKNRTLQAQRKLITSLIFSLIVPIGVVILLRGNFVNDAAALAIAGAIPAVRAIALWVWRRRVDWIGLVGAIGFTFSVAVTVFLGGSSLPLKLYRPVVTGVIGLLFLISTVVGKPLLLVLLRNVKHIDTERFNSPGKRKKIALMTAVVGLILICDSAAHIIMALTLSTATYIVMSRVITIGAVAILVGVRVVAQRNK